MSDFFGNIFSRRSCKKYKSTPVPKELVEKICKAGSCAASGMNNQSPIIVAISNKEVRDRLSRLNASIMGRGEECDPFYNAPVVIVVLAEKKIPTHIYDGSLVMGNMMLAAKECGLDSCWIHRAKEEFETEEGKAILKSLNITEEYEGIGHLILGYGDYDELPFKPRKKDYIYYID